MVFTYNKLYNLSFIIFLMAKKRLYFTFLIIFSLFFILLLPQISANFACGKVNGSNEVSSSWFNVRVYYLESPEKYTTCKVSPSDNKYCCDPQEIKGVNWAIGKNIGAKILDGGYVAGPVNLTISGEGYDIFPEMQIKKGMYIYSPNKTIYLNTTSIFVNISSFLESSNLSYILNKPGKIVSKKEICSNCNYSNFYLNNLDFGMYELKIIATNNLGEQISEKKNFAILEYLNFEREIKCKYCIGYFIFSGQKVQVTISLEASNNISGTLKDYFPNDWKFIDGGKIEEISETYNSVSWKVGGKDIEKTYSLIAPRTFFTKRYTFQSEFESYLSKKYKAVLHRFYKFFAFPEKYSKDSSLNSYFRYAKISPKNPFVINTKNKFLVQVTIFPSTTLNNVYYFVHKKSPVKLKGAKMSFVLGSNIDNSNIKSALIKFKIKKPFFWRHIEEVKLFEYDAKENSWKPLKTSLYKKIKKYSYYQATSNGIGIFAIKIKYGWGGN